MKIQGPSKPSPPVSSGRDILVVDDNETNLIAIEAALEPLGRQLVFARSGGAALRSLLQHDFALILLDVAMPGIDGFETARLMRSRDRNRMTPIIFITAVAWGNDNVLRGYDLGAFDYLMKPLEPDILRAKARVFVELQDRTLELQAAQALAHRQELEAQRRQHEAQSIEQRMKQLVELDQRKDEFLAILAHELRNPLQPLLTAIDMIEASPQATVSDGTKHVLRRNLNHVNRLVEDLLDVARLSSGKLVLRREPLLIDQVLELAVAQCRPQFESRKQQLVVDKAGRDAIVLGDSLRLVQIVSNLLSNASRYTREEGAIEVHAAIDKGDVVVRVADNGRGISASVLPRIFEMFVQERIASDGSGGLGLGLGLVKRLVELHGGTVRATSSGVGAGSTFEVRLPLSVPAAVELPHETARVEPQNAHITQPVPTEQSADGT